jgi:C-terminal processing protease CtpA/Prc
MKSTMRVLIAILLTMFSFHTFSEEQGEKGFKMDVNVSGFFSPEVTKATIKSVVQGSSAEKEGVKVGDDVVAIDGCKIPGCSASIAKESLQKSVGEVVILSMLKPNGDTYEANVTLQ